MRSARWRLTWRSPCSYVWALGSLHEIDRERSRVRFPVMKLPKLSEIRLDGPSIGFDTIDVKIEAYACRRILSRRERRQAARHGRRFPRAVPAVIEWRIFIGSDDPTRLGMLKSTALEGAPFRELIR